MRILGVDPGVSGAIAIFDTTQERLAVFDMPSVSFTKNQRKRRVISEIDLVYVIDLWAPDVAYLEAVHAMPKQGVTSVFTFGMAFGVVRGILAALAVPTHLITPNEWKRALRLGADKQEARLLASRLFPQSAEYFSRVCDADRAEAALLALFGARSTTQHNQTNCPA
jgi:Holliday junction resolvasome RuvABC endonuclease subunit